MTNSCVRRKVLRNRLRRTCDSGDVSQLSAGKSSHVSTQAETDQMNLLQRHVQTSH